MMQACIGQLIGVVARLQRRGLSQKTIAERIGVDQGTVSRLANGKTAGIRFEPAVKLIEMGGGHIVWPDLTDEARDAA